MGSEIGFQRRENEEARRATIKNAKLAGESDELGMEIQSLRILAA
jgi:hypothetical protein